MARKLGKVSKILGLAEKTAKTIKIWWDSDVSTTDKFIATVDVMVESAITTGGVVVGGATGGYIGLFGGPYTTGAGATVGGIAGGEIMGRAYDKAKSVIKDMLKNKKK